MEDISRADLDRACQILSNYVGTDESIKLAEKIRSADMIPKLYVYTYIKRVRNELKDSKVWERDFLFEDFELVIENLSALELYFLKSKTDIKKLWTFLSNAFQRETEVCDFEDSIYHNKREFGFCENEYHNEDSEKPLIKETLYPIWGTDESTQKLDDTTVKWFCKNCCDNADFDYDTPITCDMDLEA